MTVEELIEIYEAAVTKRYTEWVNAPEDDNISNDMLKRAGVTAIVRALRDEMGDPSTFKSAKPECCGRGVPNYKDGSEECCCQPDVWILHEEMLVRINEILGDAGEKVAEMPDLPTRTVQLTGVTKSRRPDIQFEPATDAAPAFYAGQDPKISLNTDAAPAVCEWRGSKDGQLAYMGCTKRLEWTYDRRKCPSCGKSITFTEAK